MILKELRPALVLLVLMTVITGFIYPYAVTGVAHLVFPRQAEGSLVEIAGKPVGSTLIGQNFTQAGYFHGRPSATTGPDPKDASKTVAQPYNATGSTGSNYGPTAKALVDRVTDDTKALKAENPKVPVPVDLVTTSASGLDPDITPAAAYFQAPRVAAARHLPEEKVKALIADNTQGRALGLFGEPRVNVLALNLALDNLAK